MNNLKRVLSLALTGAMLVGTMLVGASAANTGFSDQAEIKHTDAVNTLVALEVINGKDDGSYDPNGSLTRAEMAKLIVFVLNGGKAPVMSTKAVPTYTDIKGHWAEKYIEYCSNLGIIAGRGDGTFDPAGVLTGSQAAKMMLVAMEYKADVFGFTGTDWELNVNAEANKAGLYEELSGMDPSTTITRDQAAQLVYNGILANTMKLSWSQDQNTGAITQIYNLTGQPLFETKFNGQDDEGILTGYSYDEDKAEWTYTVQGMAPQKSDKDVTDLFGMNVRVLYSSVNGKVTNYGFYAKDSSVLAEGYAGDIPATAADKESVKINGTTVKLDSTADALPIVNQNRYNTVIENLDDVLATASGYSFKVIDNNGDAKADLIVRVPFTVAKVTYVGTSSLAIDSGIGSKDFDDVDLYESPAKNDYVMYVAGTHTANGKPSISKLAVTSSAIEGKKDSKWLVDGTWVNNISGTTVAMGDTVDHITLGTVMYVAKVTSGETGSRALGMVYDIGVATRVGVGGAELQAKMIFADGTKKTVTIAKINGVDVKTGVKAGSIADVTTANQVGAGTDASGSATAAMKIQDVVGELVNYKVNNDGDYEIKFLAGTSGYANELLGYDGVTAASTFTTADNKIGKELADDAVVFVYIGTANTAGANNAAYIYTGKELKNTGANYGTASTKAGNAVYGKVNGFTYTQVAALAAAAKPAITTGANYGYLVSDAYVTYNSTDKKDYVNFKFWDGSEEVEAQAEGTNVDGFVAGAVITFDRDGDKIKNVSVPKTLVTGKVTGWDGTKKIELDSDGRELDSDTVILYVDSAKKTGVAGDIGIIGEAADVDTTVAGTENNVRYIKPATGKKVSLLVVDVNNYMKAAPAMVVSTAADAVTALTNNGSANLVGNVNATDAATVLAAVTAGKTLTVTGNMAAPAAATTVVANSKVVITGTLTLDSTAANTLTVNGTLEVKDIADADIAQLAMGATGKIVYGTAASAAVMGKFEALTAGTIEFKTASNAAAANKWYTTKGVQDTDGASGTTNGVAAATVAASTAVPAGTYKYEATAGWAGTDGETTPTVSGWFKQ